MKTWIEISKNNLLHNFRVFQKLIRPAKIMAVVKANAYGHGAREVVNILNADAEFQKNGWLGVDSLAEALAIHFKSPILILGYTPKNELASVIKNGYRQVVYHPKTIITLENLAKKYKTIAQIHLKLETGTNRQGIGERELPVIIETLKKCPRVRVEGVYSHFADIEDTEIKPPKLLLSHSFAGAQFRKFVKLAKQLQQEGIHPKIQHLAASAASLLYPEAHLDCIRLGISLYGLYSIPTKILKLHPVLSWKTIVAQIKTIQKGETVGYGRTWRALQDSRLAVLPIGYADGYSRRFGNKARVIINGQYAPIVGRICMNMCMADVSNIKNIKIEDEVIVIGQSGSKKITVEELAELDGTINYEIVARLNPLITRRVV